MTYNIFSIITLVILVMTITILYSTRKTTKSDPTLLLYLMPWILHSFIFYTLIIASNNTQLNFYTPTHVWSSILRMHLYLSIDAYALRIDERIKTWTLKR